MTLRFVLVNPRNPLNIGAAARAMGNFGFTDLAVVKPFAPVWQETKSAVGAETIIQNAQSYETLEDATAGCSLVVGTTAVRERCRDRPVVDLPQLKPWLAKEFPSALTGASIALVFGPEKTGLSAEHLACCHFWLTIPTHPNCPSMNLGQSVALCSYEWARALDAFRPGTPSDTRTDATVAQRRRLAQHAEDVMDAVGYLPFMSPEEKTTKIRDKLLHWRIRRQDVALLHGLFRFILKSRRNDGMRGNH